MKNSNTYYDRKSSTTRGNDVELYTHGVVRRPASAFFCRPTVLFNAPVVLLLTFFQVEQEQNITKKE